MDERGLIRPHHTKLAALHKLLDAVLIALAYLVFVSLPAREWTDLDSLTVILVTLVFYRFAESNELYRSWRISSLAQEAVTICKSWIGTAAVVVLIAVVLDVTHEYPAPGVRLWALAVPFLIVAWHVALRLALRHLRARGYNTRSVGIVGLNDLGLQLADSLQRNLWMGFQLVGFFDDRSPDQDRLPATDGYPVTGGLADLLERATAGDLDVVFIALPLRAEQRTAQLISELRDTTASVYLAQDFRAFEILHGQSFVLGNVPLISVHENPFSGVSGVVKRMEDIVLSVAIIALMTIPAAIIAVGVKLSSPGPVLFKQRRYGLDSRKIQIWKFRTMTVSEDGDHIRQTTRSDPRVTRFGRFLRRMSLDELPQFINVLRGEMSIVGPRPHAVAHNEQYRKLVKSYMLRHKVKPGITGLAQVNGWRGETATLEDMKRRVELDLEYIRNWSLALDLKIIVLTLLGGFTGKKAY